MNFLSPLFASIFSTGAHVLDKWTISNRHLSYKTYLGLSFPIYLLCFLPLVFAFGSIPSQETTAVRNLLILFALVVLSLCENILSYRALKKGLLTELSSIQLLEIFPVILIASILLPSERHALSIVAGLVAGAAILLSHWKNGHFRFEKNTLVFFGWILLGAPIQAVVSRELLHTWDPTMLSFVRIACVTLILNPLVLKTSSHVPRHLLLSFIGVNLLYTFSVVLHYVSYQHSGIIYTSIMFLLTPIFTYAASILFLKEKPNWRKNIAFATVLIAVFVINIAK